MMTPRSQLEIYLDQLAGTHHFTLEQLAENRAGRLHPVQLARRRSSGFGAGIGCLVFAVLVLVGSVGGALALYDDFRKPISRVDMNGLYLLGGGGTVVALVMFVAAFFMFRGVKQRRAVFDRGQVHTLQGQLQKIHIRRGRNPDSFLYELEGHRFNVDREGWDMVTQGMRYKIYYLERDLLSIEPA